MTDLPNLPFALLDHAVKEFAEHWQTAQKAKDTESEAESSTSSLRPLTSGRIDLKKARIREKEQQHYASLLLDLCGDGLLIGACQILDDCSIICHRHTPSTRDIWEISERDSVHYLFPGVNYCRSCMERCIATQTRQFQKTLEPSAKRSTEISAAEPLLEVDFGLGLFVCQHVLAVRMAKIMDKFEVRETTAVGLAGIMNNMALMM